jgi:hypothetical protein
MLASDHKRQSILRYSFSALWMHIATCWQARSAATLACRLTRNIKRLAILVLIWRQYTFIHRDTRGHASAEFRALQLLANTVSASCVATFALNSHHCLEFCRAYGDRGTL